MARISVIGHFGEGLTLLNGQTIKTKIITNELEKHFGKSQVLRIDSHGGLKTILKAPFQVFNALKNSKNVIMLPAHNGLRIYAPLLRIFRSFYRNRKLHYVVIGGWLPQFLNSKKLLTGILKHFDALYVETNTMKNALEDQGFQNIFVMPNCKELQILTKEELEYPNTTPYKICTFSRVMKEKGIEDIVNVVKNINSKLDFNAYSLDIYGQIDFRQNEWFNTMKGTFPEYINYCGCVDANKSVNVLKDYFLLVFPTNFYTEGVPGTIIDAYAAGIPVISAKWESFSDIVDENITGIGYEFNNTTQLESILFDLVSNPNSISSMKMNCIAKASNYLPGIAIQTLVQNLN